MNRRRFKLKRILILTSLGLLLVGACAPTSPAGQAVDPPAEDVVTVFRSPT